MVQTSHSLVARRMNRLRNIIVSHVTEPLESPRRNTRDSMVPDHGLYMDPQQWCTPLEISSHDMSGDENTR
ncbi:uncharacterized protein YALI1_C07216g [Yarrowia lipolytica]|uniref:Uncharacterized protein n=1 Tax=Yarrowia lipolytica TaxID=4952 RepID=A0A1D8N9S4_YARLL|nr:hypothetical protein YALI1_C07216g [Yarrowia lipolytica]